MLFEELQTWTLETWEGRARIQALGAELEEEKEVCEDLREDITRLESQRETSDEAQETYRVRAEKTIDTLETTRGGLEEELSTEQGRLRASQEALVQKEAARMALVSECASHKAIIGGKI